MGLGGDAGVSGDAGGLDEEAGNSAGDAGNLERKATGPGDDEGLYEDSAGLVEVSGLDGYAATQDGPGVAAPNPLQSDPQIPQSFRRPESTKG